MNTTTTEPEGWRPEPGDVLEGKVVSLDQGWSDYGNAFYPIVTVQTTDGKVINVHCFHAVLRNRMMAVEPGPGDRIKVTCHGKRQTRDGKREVTVYTVESDKPQDAASFWDRMGRSAWNRTESARDPRRSAPAPAPPAPDPDLGDISDDDIPF